MKEITIENILADWILFNEGKFKEKNFLKIESVYGSVYGFLPINVDIVVNGYKYMAYLCSYDVDTDRVSYYIHKFLEKLNELDG